MKRAGSAAGLAALMSALTLAAPAAAAPCAGTVTTWRVNAAVSQATFRLRVIRDNGDGTYTSTASSAAQTTYTPPGIAVFRNERFDCSG